MTARIVALTAGTRAPSTSRRLAERIALATAAALDGPATVRVLEAGDLAHDAVTATLGGVSSSALREALAAMTTADALVVVSPVFNGSVAGLMKVVVDLLPPGSLAGIPAAIGITGGTDRHALVLDHALRPLLSTLHASVVPTGVQATAGDLADGVRAEAVAARIARAGRELATAVAPSHRRSPEAIERELAGLLEGLA